MLAKASNEKKFNAAMTTPNYSKTSGTSAQLLAEQHMNSIVALDALETALEATEFNSRDYLPAEFKAAVAEREAVFEKLKQIRVYLEAHMEAALDA